jgi:hypothetical protein
MMMVVGISSLAVSLLDIKPYFHLQIVPHMTQYHQVGRRPRTQGRKADAQLWRILVHPFAFANSTELFMAELVLYNVGVSIERYVFPASHSRARVATNAVALSDLANSQHVRIPR